MNKRNSTSKNRKKKAKNTRKKREELSVSASKTVKKEHIEIVWQQERIRPEKSEVNRLLADSTKIQKLWPTVTLHYVR